jgi:hypothetical protein
MIVDGVLRPDQEAAGYEVVEVDENTVMVRQHGRTVARFYSTNEATNPKRIQGLVDQHIALEEE